MQDLGLHRIVSQMLQSFLLIPRCIRVYYSRVRKENCDSRVLASKNKRHLDLDHDLSHSTDVRLIFRRRATLSLAADSAWEISRMRVAAHGASPLLLLVLAIF